MVVIRSKKDVESFMTLFDQVAAWDELGGKRYFILPDRERGGRWTLMRYPHGSWTLHGQGEDYCDPDETSLSAEEVGVFVWKNRALIHRAVADAGIAI